MSVVVVDGSVAEKKAALQLIEDASTTAGKIQERVLQEILSRCADVEYLQRHGLNGRTDQESFKKLLPVATYEDLQPDINRIANGDTGPILCDQPISEFLTSFGTSGGEKKLIPTTKEELERRSLLYSLLMPVMDQFVPGLQHGKGMYFLFEESEVKTPGGLVARPVLTSYINPNINYTSPKETILCPDPYQSTYSQLLCGLCQREQVLRVGAAFASNLVRAIRFLEQHWTLLCNDIRSGTLNPQITDPSVRNAVSKILKPEPELADFIEAECSTETWQGIITRLWPNTKYIDVTVIAGTMSQYITNLRKYYSNDLPLVCTMYASSQCCYLGLNLKPLCEVSFTLLPTMAYFEFLPVKNNGVQDSISLPTYLNDKEQQESVDLVGVKLGKEYELIVTTYAGMYRYRVGDVLRVTGFKNKAPQFILLSSVSDNADHNAVLLTIDSDEIHNAEDSDKTEEINLQMARRIILIVVLLFIINFLSIYLI